MLFIIALFIVNMSAFCLVFSRGCIHHSSLPENLLTWASPCPLDGSLSGSTLFENNWLLGSIVAHSERQCYDAFHLFFFQDSLISMLSSCLSGDQEEHCVLSILAIFGKLSLPCPGKANGLFEKK